MLALVGADGLHSIARSCRKLADKSEQEPRRNDIERMEGTPLTVHLPFWQVKTSLEEYTVTIVDADFIGR